MCLHFARGPFRAMIGNTVTPMRVPRATACDLSQPTAQTPATTTATTVATAMRPLRAGVPRRRTRRGCEAANPSAANPSAADRIYRRLHVVAGRSFRVAQSARYMFISC